MNDQEIKALTPTTCPHCGKQIIVEFVTAAPKLTSVLTVDLIEAAKQDCISRIDALGVDESISRPMIEWLRNPETLFGPDDIETIIRQLKEQNHDGENRLKFKLTGMVFGNLTVIKYVGSDKNRNSIWECLCKCGNKKKILGYRLRNGETKSCGCLYQEYIHKEKRIDLTGKRFGRLVVLSSVKKLNKGKLFHECQCDCGNKVKVCRTSLILGKTKSCGCLNRELLRLFPHGKTSHGMSSSRQYHVYYGIRQRCYDTKNINYKYYGGRGITVCQRWRDSFENFWKDMGPTYKDGLQIDRINNDGNYEPGNVRWVTPKVNNHNRRNSKHDSPKVTTTSQLPIP